MSSVAPSSSSNGGGTHGYDVEEMREPNSSRERQERKSSNFFFRFFLKIEKNKYTSSIYIYHIMIIN